MITKVINVNLHQPIYERLTAKQGDIASRYLLFHLLDGDKPFDLSNRTVRVYAIKPDKTEIFNDLTINDASKGYCTLELTSQCLASAGVVKMELYISESGKVLTSIPFELEVIKCINTTDSIISTNEFTALTNGLASLSEYDNYKNEIAEARHGFTTLGKRLGNFDSQLDTKASKIELAKESARIDVFTSLTEGSTTGDAELIDGRVCNNAVTYKNIGSAIRSQFEIVDSQINNYTTLLDYNKLDNLQVGFIGLDGLLNTSSTAHKVVKISAKNIKSFRIIKGANELTSGLCYGVFKKSDGTVNRIIPYNIESFEKELTDENRECDIYLNWFNFGQNLYCSSIEIKYLSIDEMIETAINGVVSTIPQEVIKYHHCVNKPFNFQGKEIAFFGDSITEGFVNGSSITQNGYPKLFAESVGATYKNYGVGGSCFSMVYNGIDTIVNKVKAKLKSTSPFAFFAGGVNDWQCGVTKQQLRSAIVELCTWLKANYTGTVIFITPINFAGRTPITTPQMTIWEVRQIITEVVLSYNYNVVQGWMFPFPTEVGTYSSTVFGDGLHLTEDPGYKIYSQSLKTILC